MNTNQKILFMAGFPRSGSTLLMNILAQNPDFQGSNTSGLLGTVTNIKNNWMRNPAFRANGSDYIYPRIGTMLKGLMSGFYENELSSGKIVIDKNRGWASQIDFLEEIYESKVKIIFPIRNVVDSMISLEKAHRKSVFISPIGQQQSKVPIRKRTTAERAEHMLSNEGILGGPIATLREIQRRGMMDRLVVVPYNNLLENPTETLQKIYTELGMSNYEHDFENITQTVGVEEDLYHGFAPKSLHQIQEGKLLPAKERDATIYDSKYIETVEIVRFPDISKMINNLKL